jgi:predicted DNA-binding mobile mystery protein A
VKTLDDLALNQINRRLSTLADLQTATVIRESWIGYIRRALQMTLKDLGNRLEVNPSAIAQAERNELSGKISLGRLRKIANAMDCDLVYAFIPKGQDKTIQSITLSHALLKAELLLKEADLHMELEDQKVNQSLEERIHQLAKKLIDRGEVW